ncbi:MAG: dihydrofolate reductase family protein [bacterium]
MATVVADMSMTLDGFVAGPQDQVEHVFAWMHKGQHEVTAPGDDRTFTVDSASAEHLDRAFRSVGALVCGRRLFDLTHGWSGKHPVGAPVYVVTHTAPDDWAYPEAPFTFVTDGVESAIRQASATAGDKVVAIASSTIAQQCLDAGLLDVIHVSLVPVLLGGGIRFFDHLRTAPIELEDRPRVIEGIGVTHLEYTVRARSRPSDPSGASISSTT